MGCLTASAIAALGASVIMGYAFRDRWRTPKPLTPIAAAVGDAAFAAEVARFAARAMVPQGQPVDAPTEAAGVGWSRFVHRFDIGADECVALVVASHEGYAAPKQSGLFVAGTSVEREFDGFVAQYTTQPASGDPRWLYVASTEGLATSLTWCAHAPRSVEARVMFRTVDGFSPPRRADATARWQLLRAPWATYGGPRALHGTNVQRSALEALANEFTAPLEAAQRVPPEGLSERAPAVDVMAGAAALVPLNTTSAVELYALAARDAGVPVNPRVLGPLSDEQRAIVTNAFNASAANRALPAEHDAIVDLGRNDFYRVLAVIDGSQLPAECVTITLARGQGLFSPSISRYSRLTRQRTPLANVRDNLATDRVCPTDGLFSYIVDDTDQMQYRLTQWGAAQPAPATRGRRGR